MIAWFKAVSTASISPATQDSSLSVTYTEFSTDLGSVTVTLKFHQTNSGNLRLATYNETDPDDEGAQTTGWNHCYLTDNGAPVWNSGSAPANAYGSGTLDYQTFEVIAEYTITAEQAAMTPPASFVISGKTVTITGTGFKIWSAASIADSGAAPTGAGTSAINIPNFTLTAANFETAGAYTDTLSGFEIGVFCDGTLYAPNPNASAAGTLGFGVQG